MKASSAISGLLLALVFVAATQAKEISGEYLEARSCDVYTGPCFANGEVGISGKEAVLAWMIDQGTWKGQDVAGLGAALIVNADDTLGFGGSFNVRPEKIASVILVDERANAAQHEALVAFVRESAPELAKDVVRIEKAPLSLTNDHLSGKGVFRAGSLAKIETRKLAKGDCVCSNEVVFYPPLTKVDNARAAYTVNMTFAGEGLNKTWSTVNKRSAFLATFAR